jgi:hypothetical protein
MTPQRECLVNYRKFDTPEKVGLGDGRIVEAEGVSNVHLNLFFKVSDSKRAVMYDVLYVPKLACNLFSVRAAARKGNVIKFGRSKCWIRDQSGSCMVWAPVPTSCMNLLASLTPQSMHRRHVDKEARRISGINAWAIYM